MFQYVSMFLNIDPLYLHLPFSDRNFRASQLAVFLVDLVET